MRSHSIILKMQPDLSKFKQKMPASWTTEKIVISSEIKKICSSNFSWDSLYGFLRAEFWEVWVQLPCLFSASNLLAPSLPTGAPSIFEAPPPPPVLCPPTEIHKLTQVGNALFSVRFSRFKYFFWRILCRVLPLFEIFFSFHRQSMQIVLQQPAFHPIPHRCKRSSSLALRVLFSRFADGNVFRMKISAIYTLFQLRKFKFCISSTCIIIRKRKMNCCKLALKISNLR